MMATNQKLKPCPKCGKTDALDVYTYDPGWRHVQCHRCFYLGPGAGSVRFAIMAHNQRVTEALPGDGA